MSTVSPQGYQILTNPINNNPFWEVEIEGDHIKTLYCTKTTEGDFDYYAWTYKDQDDVIHPIITQQVSNKAGEDGAIFTPSVSAEGVISWTNNGGLPNPQPISIRGIQGPQGPQGIQGPAGATGPQGETGPQGPRGLQGPQGEIGPTGPQGLTGPQGPAGADGTVEFEDLTPAQIEMLRGPQGVQGPAGPTGPQGPTGAQGPQGVQGETGPQGPAGLGTVTVGTTTTGAEGTQASVTNSGTTQDAILNFTIPKGDTGATGPQGPQGPAGQDGAGTIAVGTTTTGAAGTNASVTNSGTAQNAILDFTIPQGAQGPAGQDGADGADGAAATIAVGTVTTGQPGTQATVTNSGTSSAAVFDFTIPQGAAGQNGTNGQGVPTGGTAGQVLAKVDGTDYNTEWVTPSGGGGGAPTMNGTSRAVAFSNSKNGSASGSYSEFNINSTAGIWIDAGGKILYDANPGYDYSGSGCRSLYIPLFKESSNTLKGTGMLISTFADSNGKVCVAYAELLATITFSGSTVTISLSLQPAQYGGSTGLAIKDVYGTPTYSADLSLWNGSVYVYACNS